MFKGQSAVEYLMTYGWMLLVVAVTGGAIFSMVGEQSIESVQGFNSQDVNVEDFGVSTQNGLMFSMSDPIGRTTVTEITVGNPDAFNVTYVVNQKVSEDNIVNLPGIMPGEEGSELEVEIKYDSGNLENLTTSGTVKGGLKVDESYNNRTVILDGLVGYWPLSEKYSSDDTVYDLTKNNNHGYIDESVSFVGGLRSSKTTAANFSGEASSFDAKDLSGGLSGLTITFWAETNESTYGVIRGDGEGDTLIAHRLGSSASFYLRAEDGTNSGYIEGFGDTPINEPFFGAIWWNGEETRTYIGDELQNSTIFSPNEDVELNRLRVGHTIGTGLTEYEGMLEEVSIYDRALSEGEISEIYDGGMAE